MRYDIIYGAFFLVSYFSKDLVRIFFSFFLVRLFFQSLQKVTHHRCIDNMKINQNILLLFLSLVFILYLQGENSLRTQHFQQPPLPSIRTIKMEFIKIIICFLMIHRTAALSQHLLLKLTYSGTPSNKNTLKKIQVFILINAPQLSKWQPALSQHLSGDQGSLGMSRSS